MDFLLDTCVIYDNYDFTSNNHRKTKLFLKSDNNFIISYFQKEIEIPNLIERKNIFAREIYKKIINPTYKVFGLQKLTISEKSEFKKILIRYANYNLTQKDIIELKKRYFEIMRGINKFVTNKTSFVIPIKKINQNLVDDLFKLNHNKADSEVISSGIQAHQTNKIILMTADKSDWKKEHLNVICNKYKLDEPKLEYIQDYE
ncbi:MAG: hypothetical protein PF542_04180 [Nanoarchaeota archaeon]|jgi:hypothetical protein|nr:hypothetical protein [Nanoarchaeota archaeon]